MSKDETEVTHKKLAELIEQVNNSEISSIKQIIIHLITVINDPDSSAKDLKDIIEKDPPLSARLLKIANSVYYGFRRKISKIQDAIIGIGFDAVKELALSQKVCELFNKNDSIDGYSRLGLWENSIAVALCSKLVYMREFRDPGEKIYIAGLLHNIGIIIEDQFMQNQFKETLVDSQTNKCNLMQSEKNIFGFDHADIGRALTDNWEFPRELVVSIGLHHTPELSDARYGRIVRTLFISDYICQKNDIGYKDASYGNKRQYYQCLASLNIQEEAIDLIMEDVLIEIDKMKKSGWLL